MRPTLLSAHQTSNQKNHNHMQQAPSLAHICKGFSPKNRWYRSSYPRPRAEKRDLFTAGTTVAEKKKGRLARFASMSQRGCCTQNTQALKIEKRRGPQQPPNAGWQIRATFSRVDQHLYRCTSCIELAGARCNSIARQPSSHALANPIPAQRVILTAIDSRQPHTILIVPWARMHLYPILFGLKKEKKQTKYKRCNLSWAEHAAHIQGLVTGPGTAGPAECTLMQCMETQSSDGINSAIVSCKICFCHNQQSITPCEYPIPG